MSRVFQSLVFAAGLVLACGCGDERESGVGFCFTCVGVDTAPPDEPPDLAESCFMADNAFECVCTTVFRAPRCMRSFASKGCRASERRHPRG